MKLSNDCIDTKCNVPPECEQHNAVYNILHYLVDVDFIKVNVSIGRFGWEMIAMILTLCENYPNFRRTQEYI